MKLERLLFWKYLSEQQKYRLLEMIPGSLVWLTFGTAFVLSFIRPLWVIYFIIVYAFFWLIRVFYFVFYLTLAWRKYRQEIKVDWVAKVSELPNWRRIHHVVFYPTWKEPFEVVRETVASLSQVSYPLDRIICAFGGEERAGSRVNKKLAKLEAQFKDTFLKFQTTIHVLQPDELAGKGANAVFMAKEFQKWVDRQGIPYEDIIVSNFDSDTQVDPQYFARLTYAYLTDPDPTHASYQPLVLYNNNIWSSPSFTRVVSNATTFWLMTELARPEQFMTFSSHSMPFKALVEVGFWDKTIVTEDSRIYLQCFVHYQGNYRLVPLYVPLLMDTVAVKSLWRTVVNQYKQMRRWAWSAEHQAWLFTKFFRQPNTIPLWHRVRYMWKLVEGQFAWATGAMLLFIFGRLPLSVASAQQSSSVLVQNVPFILEDLMLIGMIGILLSAVLNVTLLPAKPPKHGYVRYLGMVLQWILLPITVIVFGSIPAIDAQTRLLINKRLGFWNTEKDRK